MSPKSQHSTIPQLSKDYTTADEIAIIGGGAAGLASAYFLIEAGHSPGKISIYEKENYFGGHGRTLYLHKVSVDELYVIQAYEMEFENNYKDIFLLFNDHNNTSQRIKINGNPNIIPVDVGVCGFSKNYFNFKNLLSRIVDKKGIPFLEYDYLEEVSRSINLDNLILRSDKMMAGQLWYPWNWYRLFRLKRGVKKIVTYCNKKGMPYLQSITVKDLLAELKANGISQDALDLLSAFCQVGSGYSHAQFAEISAGYLFSFFMQGNFNNAGENNTIFLYGVSVYLYKLVSYLKNKGVSFKKDGGDSAKHTIYAVQPYDAKQLNSNLPEMVSTKSIVYIHCDSSFQGKVDTVLSYGKINNINQATWDLDRMRPKHPDMGAYITFSIPDYESTIDKQLFKANKAQFISKAAKNSQNLYKTPLKHTWQHAFINITGEEVRRDIWQNHQGKNNEYYCSSSYLYCMLHENAITSALDTVCLLTGKHKEVAALGFKISDYTNKIHGT